MKNQVRRAMSMSVGLGAFALLAQSTLGSVIGGYVDNGDGTFTYSYLVDNTTGPFDISAWSLDFPFSTPDWDQLDAPSGGEVTIPNFDWSADKGVPVTGLSAQDFLSLAPAGDVLVGQSLSGFSFTSRFLPGQVAFLEFSANGASAGGSTVGPALIAVTVPEPGGKVAELAFAAVAVFTAGRRVVRARA
jgi:hypothetical protein